MTKHGSHANFAMDLAFSSHFSICKLWYWSHWGRKEIGADGRPNKNKSVGGKTEAEKGSYSNG